MMQMLREMSEFGPSHVSRDGDVALRRSSGILQANIDLRKLAIGDSRPLIFLSNPSSLLALPETIWEQHY